MATSWVPHIESFVDSTRPLTQQNASLDAIATLIKNDLVAIEALVTEMAMYLTTTDNVLRTRGILLIAEILKCLATKKLEGRYIADWQALHGALVGCLSLLRRKGNVGVVIDSDAGTCSVFLKNIQLCFEILECLFERYPATVATLGDDLLYSICEAIDEEMDPYCLMVTFHLVEILPQLFPDPSGPLAGYAEELFEILGRYFPIHFTHPNSNEFDITRDDLARALMLAFSSTPLYEPFVLPMLLEKLSCSLPSAKVDSLRYLSNCIKKYGTDRMVKHRLSEVDGKKIDENEIAKEAQICLQKFIFQDDASALGKQKLHALGCILSTSVKVSTSCCNKVFQNFFPRLVDILRLSTEYSSRGFTSDDTIGFSEELNFGALYLCVELLIACRCLIIRSKECAPQPDSVEDPCCCLLNEYSVMGMQTLAAFPGCSLPISKLISERILAILVSVISDSREDTFLWRIALNALKEVGIFIEQSHDSEKANIYMAIVVERVVSLIPVSESSMPLPLRLEAVSVVGAAGKSFMLRVSEVLGEAISENLISAFIGRTSAYSLKFAFIVQL
ncbi:hypothetical protein MKW92_051478 [Papaver armeniacum]|nr:hypothetical protein MKW92_051478 [Papaver armeniacum]